MPATRHRSPRADAAEPRGSRKAPPRSLETPGAARPGSEAAASPRQAPSPADRARHDRGAETRRRLIEAGLDVFGRLGFEGATTRMIAKEAGANLAAIVYHFGSKEALHLAVAEHIVASIRSRIGPGLATASVPETTASPAAARAAFERLIEAFIEVILGSAEAERWARFLIREQLQPTPSFEIIYGFMGPAQTIGSRLVAAALGRPESEETRLRVLTFMGQVMVFRVAQEMVLRRMGWTAIGKAERAAIRKMVIAQINAVLDREARR